jgi:hypothetical protein
VPIQSAPSVTIAVAGRSAAVKAAGTSMEAAMCP